MATRSFGAEITSEVTNVNSDQQSTKIIPTKAAAPHAPIAGASAAVLTSTVIKEIRDWSDLSLLIPHEPIRLDLIRFEKLLQHERQLLSEDWRMAEFFGLWERFAFFVHHHHDAEEEIFLAWMRTRCTTLETKDDHAQLLADLQAITDMCSAFGVPAVKSARKRIVKSKVSKIDTNLTAEAKHEAFVTLREKFTALKSFMEEHLAEEEESIPALLREHFTEKEHDKIIDKIVKSLGLSGNKKMLPWVTEGMSVWGNFYRPTFMSALPPPIRLMHNKFWAKGYRNKYSTRFDALVARPIPSAEKDQGLYELRKYHHNANWTPENRTAYIQWVKEDFTPLAKGAGWNITSFWVKPADGSHDTRTSGPALFTQGETTTGHEESAETFPTAVWMVRWESKQQREEAFAGLMGSPEGQACLARNPFNTKGKVDLAGYELIEEHFLENQLFSGLTRPNIAGRSLGGVHEIRTYYLNNEKFDRLRADEATDSKYIDWADKLFTALSEMPEFKDRITCLFVDNSAKDAALAEHENYTSGAHVLDPENNPAPEAPALRPKVFWSLHWDSKEQCDAAWGRVFTSDLAKEFFKPGYNPFNEDGLMSDYLKMEFQWMEPLM